MCLNFVECNSEIRLARCLVVSKHWLFWYDNLCICSVGRTFYQSTRIQTNAAVYLLFKNEIWNEQVLISGKKYFIEGGQVRDSYEKFWMYFNFGIHFPCLIINGHMLRWRINWVKWTLSQQVSKITRNFITRWSSTQQICKLKWIMRIRLWIYLLINCRHGQVFNYVCRG